METGRIGRFVRSARALLIMQLAAAAIAVALSIWAVVEVSALAAERDRLREELAAAQAGGPSAGPSLDQPVEAAGGRSPVILPMAIPVFEPPADTNLMLPGEPVPDIANQAAPPPEEGAIPPTGNEGRTRPGRWTRTTPVPPASPEPEGNQQRPPSAN